MQATPYAIPLRDRDGTVVAVTLVDQRDAYLSALRWHRTYFGYACHTLPRAENRNKLLLHRIVLNAPPGIGIDHIDGDRLNNQRFNLRLATTAQNAQNLVTRGQSGFRGVSYCRQTGQWKARVKVNGVEHWLGRFDSELEAALTARDFRASVMPYATER